MSDFAAGLAARLRGVGARLPPRLLRPFRLRAAWLRLARRWRLAAPGARCASRAWLLAPAALAALIGVPLAVVGVHVGALGTPEVRHLAQTVLPRYAANTVALVAVVAALTGALGVTTAWLSTAFEYPGRRVLSWLLILPLALPAYIAALAYAGLFDFTGRRNCCFARALRCPPAAIPPSTCRPSPGSASCSP